MQSNDFLYIVSPIIGGLGALIIARYAKKLALLDKPNGRSSHHGVVPKGGGLGILCSFILTSLVQSLPGHVWMPAVFIATVSFWGDRHEIRPPIRLFFHFTASSVVLIGVFWNNDSSAVSYLLFFPFSVFIVGSANYYNFMDGINGIAGITGVVGFGLLAIYTSSSGTGYSLVVLCICIALSCLGFLPFNMSKAKVFMGDVGSILLGFVFAVMVILLSRSLLDFVCLAGFLFPFYADELTTLVVRVKEGDRLIRPHRRHFYQLLANEKGIAHWKVSVGYGIVQLMTGMSVMLVKPFGSFMVISLLAACFGGFAVLSFGFRRRLGNWPPQLNTLRCH